MKGLKINIKISLFFLLLSSCTNKQLNFSSKEKKSIVEIKEYVLENWENVSSSNDFPYIIIDKNNADIANGFIDSKRKLIASKELIDNLNFLFKNNSIIELWYYNKDKLFFIISKKTSMLKTSFNSVCFLMSETPGDEVEELEGLKDFYICNWDESY